jgi:hypothetical protein
MLTKVSVLLAVGMFVSGAYANHAAQATSEQVSPGAQWLAWSAKERGTYVNGFIEGYQTGTMELCKSADQFFKAGDPSTSSRPAASEVSASAACYAGRGDYSKQYASSAWMDFSVYVNIISEFYTKHPEYRDTPFSRLMLSLRDGASNNEGQLYQKATRGELR